MVEHTHDKRRKLFDQSERESRRKQRNTTQLPVLFDRLRSLFRSNNRRAMPMKDVLVSLMSMRKDKTVEQSDIEEQLEMILKHAADWCTIECDTRRNKIFVLKPRLN